MNPPGPRKIPNNLSKRSIGAASAKKHDPNKKRKHKDAKADKGPPRKGTTFAFKNAHGTYPYF